MQQNSGGTLRLEFVYDYLGRRIEKSVYPTSGASTPSSRTRFVYDGWNLIAELNALSSNAVLRTYTWGLDASGSLQGAGGVGGLLRMEEGGTAYHPVYDQSNNVTGLVRTSGTTATLVASYTYGPYGEKLQPDWAAGGYTDNNPFRYSTRYTDKETGLVYYGMRYYQPKTGRFINRDPIQEAGGLNLYTFVGNNPVNRFDILGMEGSEKAIMLDPFFVDASPWRGSLFWYRELSFRLIPPETPRPDVRIPDRLKEVVAPNNEGKEWKPNKADCDALREKYPGAVVPSGKPTGLLSAFTSATIAAGAATSSGGMEYSSIIYRNSDGSFAYTAPIPVDGHPTRIGNQVFRSPLGGRLISDNPPGTTRVAATHGHNVGFSVYSDWINVRTRGTVVPTRSDYLHYGENFSRADVNTARTIGMMGVFTPSGSVLVYPFSKYGDLAAGAEMASGHQVPGAPQGQDALHLQACINAKL